MGVINITPNSFSDSTSLISNKELLLQTLNQFRKIPGLIFDLGFESTAPMNKSIDAILERERFDHFMDSIKDFDFSDNWISFDTYRPSNYLYFEEQFKKRYSGCSYLFNDVSGVLDIELKELLEQKRKGEDFYYLYTSTHIPSRDLVGKHMQNVSSRDIIEVTRNKFSEVVRLFSELKMDHKLILDPGFGFSKSYEQNWELINRFKELEISFSQPYLIGLSKKSFLRASLPNSLDPFKDAEVLHAELVEKFLKSARTQLIFRAHDPFLVESIHARL